MYWSSFLELLIYHLWALKRKQRSRSINVVGLLQLLYVTCSYAYPQSMETIIQVSEKQWSYPAKGMMDLEEFSYKAGPGMMMMWLLLITYYYTFATLSLILFYSFADQLVLVPHHLSYCYWALFTLADSVNPIVPKIWLFRSYIYIQLWVLG